MRQQMGRQPMPPHFAVPPTNPQDWRAQGAMQPQAGPGRPPNATSPSSPMRVQGAPMAHNVGVVPRPGGYPEQSQPGPGQSLQQIPLQRSGATGSVAPGQSAPAAVRPSFPAAGQIGFGGDSSANQLPSNLSYLTDAAEAFPHSADGDGFPSLAGSDDLLDAVHDHLSLMNHPV